MEKRPRPPRTQTPGPRRPDITPREFLRIAARIQGRERAALARLSSPWRLRRWGA